jgi:cytochrome P450
MDSPILLTLVGASFAYVSFLVYHRLYLSPIAHFPGPTFAALTFWYEFYYDVILGGQYIWKIRALHTQYGPIIRINPHELHVSDPNFWDVMFSASTNSNRRNKWSWQTRGLGLPVSTLATVEHGLHRKRRAAMAPYFSMGNVRRLLPVIEERVEALVNCLTNCGKGEEVVHAEYAFSAFTHDIVMHYCFGRLDQYATPS